ncbi:MAG: hypothetical protein AAF366_01395 [Pseudomonadota bacterium]
MANTTYAPGDDIALRSGWARAAVTDTLHLRYAIAPGKVLAGATQTLTLTATVPDNGAPVALQPGAKGDEIKLTIPAPPQVTGAGALTDAVTFVAQSKTDGFIAGPDPGSANAILVKPTVPVTLSPGQRIEVALDAVAISATPGTAKIGIQEFIGTGGATADIDVTKDTPPISVTAWFEQPIVGKSETAILRWISNGGTVVTITGLETGTGQQSFPVSGKTPPFPGMLAITPTAPGPMPLTLTVRTSDGSQSNSTTVVLDVRRPYLARLAATPAPDTQVAADAEVSLDWTILYARSATLTPPSGVGPLLVPRDTLRPMKVVPGADALAGAPALDAIPASATYELIGSGFGPDIRASISYGIAPVALAYFKYQSKDPKGTLSQPGFAVLPNDWQGKREILGDVMTFTLYQPGGGSQTYYLGAADTTHPQIQYFAPAAPASGGQVTVEWVTANLDTLTLDPGGHTIAAADIASGSMAVPVPADGIVTLTGTSKTHGSVPSVLALPKP